MKDCYAGTGGRREDRRERPCHLRAEEFRFDETFVPAPQCMEGRPAEHATQPAAPFDLARPRRFGVLSALAIVEAGKFPRFQSAPSTEKRITCDGDGFTGEVLAK